MVSEIAPRELRCPLCGARLKPALVLDACEEILGDDVLACHCPYCQGYFEVVPRPHGLDIGYLRNGHFDVVLTLSCAGLAVLRDTATDALHVRLGQRTWKFNA